VATVGDYFHRFVKRWPASSAGRGAARRGAVGPGPGLGYYARARNLQACAQAVVERHGGSFPDDEAPCSPCPESAATPRRRSAPSPSTRPASAVDGNVERVIARLYAIETPLPDAKIEIAARAAELVPQNAPATTPRR
jgi:A/G-specific adenine glycosylase